MFAYIKNIISKLISKLIDSDKNKKVINSNIQEFKNIQTNAPNSNLIINNVKLGQEKDENINE